MKMIKKLRWGLYLSFTSLIVSSGALLWPLVATPRFWLTAGFVVGMIGTFLFTVVLASIDTTPALHEEE
jgi:hypothetical protein